MKQSRLVAAASRGFTRPKAQFHKNAFPEQLKCPFPPRQVVHNHDTFSAGPTMIPQVAFVRLVVQCRGRVAVKPASVSKQYACFHVNDLYNVWYVCIHLVCVWVSACVVP